MNAIRTKWVAVVVVVLLSLGMYLGLKARLSTDSPEISLQAMTCIKPFDKFAYVPDDASYPIPEILPPSPWLVEATIPRQGNEVFGTLSFQIKLARVTDGKKEIWLRQGNPVVSESQDSFLIYQPESQTWKEVSATVGDTNLSVRDIFLASDGTIWGGINTLTYASLPSKVSVLSKFNEATRQFEIAVGAPEFAIEQEQEDLVEAREIVVDREGLVWLFVPQDGIYWYDPRTNVAREQVDIPDLVRVEATLASDGSIFFRYGSSYHPEGHLLFRFTQDTGEIAAVDVPNGFLEYGAGMLVDQRGRLWLGAMGYMETDGRWHMLHPDPEGNSEHRGDPAWSQPTLMFETSNGWLWYAEHHDMGLLGEGTAWYDPETGEGCLFTNLASYIVEDAERQVWIVAQGKLYRYPLGQ